eukprot:11796841-Alexandrium_andersonii.AAC.1
MDVPPWSFPYDAWVASTHRARRLGRPTLTTSSRARFCGGRPPARLQSSRCCGATQRRESTAASR